MLELYIDYHSFSICHGFFSDDCAYTHIYDSGWQGSALPSDLTLSSSFRCHLNRAGWGISHETHLEERNFQFLVQWKVHGRFCGRISLQLLHQTFQGLVQGEAESSTSRNKWEVW